MKDHEFKNVHDLISQSESHIETEKTLDKRFVDLTYKIESIVATSKKFGIDVKDSEKLLAKSLELKNEDMEKAMKTAAKSLEIAQVAIDGFAPELESSISIKATGQ